MSVTIEVGGAIRATIQDGQWSCEDVPLKRVLDAFLRVQEIEGSDPYPDFSEAQRAVSALGGEIVRYDELPDGPPGLII